MLLSLADWLKEQCAQFVFAPAGVFQTDGELDWPLVANDADELIGQLDTGGFLTPLPSESAALANVIEVALVDYLSERIRRLAVAGSHASAERGAARGYPDLEVDGDVFGGGPRAVDIKMARIKVPRKGPPTKTESRITLYTGNTYFRYPSIKIGGIRRPFDDYREHLDIIGLYVFDESTKARVTSLELLVCEPWQVASRERSSTTREYIGAVESLADLRAGQGAFASKEAFYKYWREEYKGFKTPRMIQRELDKLLRRGGPAPG
ncbi:MAG: hypothetical protein V9E89_17975 [Ilumatobacteraceae bacterium]|jgi:hypothetical protein